LHSETHPNLQKVPNMWKSATWDRTPICLDVCKDDDDVYICLFNSQSYVLFSNE